MKKLLSFCSFLAFSVVAAMLVACHDENVEVPEPEPAPEEKTDFDPRLEGVWLLAAESEGNGTYQPVDIDNSSLFIADPNEHGAIFLDFDDLSYYESVLFADAENLVAIEHTLADYIVDALKEAGIDDPDLTYVSAPEVDEMWFLEGTYKLLDDTTLVINFTFDDGTLSGKFRRMTEVEADFNDQTRGWLDKLGKLCSTALDVIVKAKDKLIGSTYHEYDTSLPHTREWSKTNWLSLLPDSMPICHISIPGAHDACTGTVGSIGALANADCQSFTIDELLDKGLRYLDVRTRSSGMKVSDEILVKFINAGAGALNTVFRINLAKYKRDGIAWTFHGPISCEKSLESVFLDATKFLDSHPQEFVIIRVSYEAFGWSPLEQDFDKSVSVGLFHGVEKVYSERIMAFRPDIKLGEARNHILLLNDDLPSSKGDRIGSYYHKVGRGDPNYNCYIDIVTDKDSTAYSFWVQDMYEMKIDDQNSINKKIELIESVALDAREYYKDSDNMVFNNQLNANTGNPVALKCVSFAQIFNSKTYEMFRGNMLNGGDPFVGGIYSMDYAGKENYDRHAIPTKTTAVYGESVVWAIIENNFYRPGK